jgi:fructosamine-3-kinase
MSLPRAEIAAAIGAEIRDATPVGGGCINEAYRCTTSDDREIFVKTHASADESMFVREARGLSWLAEANALRVPEVLAASARFLVLEYIEEGRRCRDFDEVFGHGLAELHRFGAPIFGFEDDNYLGTLVQRNQSRETWVTFYIEQRLEPLVEMACARHLAPSHWKRSFATLYGKMHDLAGPDEPPSRLHGDLWSGNVHTSREGRPVLIDPAVYGGHREIDLAMLQLFGSPGARFFAAYDETYPRAPGHAERVALYQLYPLLAHVNLFPGGYVDSVDAALRRLI